MKKLIFLISFCLLCLPLISKGDGLVPCGGPTEPACNACHLLVLAQNVLNFAYRIISGIVIIMIVVGGFKMMFSGGNEANIQAAQKTLTSALIGLVIILCSYLIVNTIFWILAQISHTNYDFQWYKIEMNCEKVVNSNNQGNGNGNGGGDGDGGGDGQDGGLNEYGTYCNLKQVLGYGCHLASNCDYSKGPSIDHADCPPEGPEGRWDCCIPMEGVTDPPMPTRPEPDQGGPCEGGKLMTLCKNYSECAEYPECSRKLHPEYPKSYCSSGDIMTCPNSCLHECTLLEDGTSIGCD